MKLLALATVLALAGCQASEPTPSPQPVPPTSSDGITLRVATPDRIAGTYVDETGLGINFDTAKSGDNLFMHITTKTGRELIHAETIGDTYVFRYMDGRLSVEITKAWVDQVRLEGPDGDTANAPDELKWTGDMAVLDEMINLPEVRGLPHLSRALGAAGYTGKAYPAILPLHKMARQSADALGIEVAPLEEVSTDLNSFCTRPTANNCYGMCGPGCTCWSWVCGDCCYHGGCAKHDQWCREGKWYYCYNITAVIALFGC